MTIPEAALERVQQAADLLDQISRVDIPDALENATVSDVFLAFVPLETAVHRYLVHSFLAKGPALRG